MCPSFIFFVRRADTPDNLTSFVKHMEQVTHAKQVRNLNFPELVLTDSIDYVDFK